ncbi:N-6 DNA methylase [Bacillus cereus]|nr:N-6 DNA methylase [Bacillus cereus]MDA2056685.1 N-6 DNA methylase [Bacillus cereus]
MSKDTKKKEVSTIVRESKEHLYTRLPLIDKLIELGWDPHQLQFQPEWHVPKTPSEAAKREAGKSYQGFPVDVAIFDSGENAGEWEHIQIIIETKQPDINSGLSQLEIYMSLEPRALVGYWTNGHDIVGLFRNAEGKFIKKENVNLPKPTDNLLIPTEKPIKWGDLETVDAKGLRTKFERLLNNIVSMDSTSTRRDDQLNQLCNLLLIKLESDKRAKIYPDQPVIFQVWKDEDETFKKITEFFTKMKLTHTDLFSSLTDQQINLDASTVHMVCYEIGKSKLLDTSIDTLSVAFQTFRNASLKSEEGQYFTPYPIIKSAIELMDIQYDDVIIDPACGTGGFLLEAFSSMKSKIPSWDDGDAKAWAQKHLYGVDKDQINVKLTKAMMMILGDGSTHTFLGDSLKSHLWQKNWPYLTTGLQDGHYTCVITNPPFGKNLKLTGQEAKKSSYTIAQKYVEDKDTGEYVVKGNTFENRELGIIFLERCHNLLISGGRLGIILPETYFFSKSYLWLQDWLEQRFILRGLINIPMEAFQGFCRAKTNFYVFEKR